jgi:enoyl-CoA hydratase/carnithine racemase
VTTYTYDGRQVTAAEMLRLVMADQAAEAEAEARSVIRAIARENGEPDPEPGSSASQDELALSAQEYAVWALERAGFRDAMSDGRDPWDGLTITAPGGGQIQITPVNQMP